MREGAGSLSRQYKERDGTPGPQPGRETWLGVSAQPFSSCVTLDESLPLCKPQHPLLYSGENHSSSTAASED